MQFGVNIGKTMIARGCASLNGTDNRFAASWVRVPNEPLHRVGSGVWFSGPTGKANAWSVVPGEPTKQASACS
jgi:hypothetical protein